MGRKSSRKKLKEELSLETIYIKNFMRQSREYAKRMDRTNLPFAERHKAEMQDAYLLLLNACINFQINMEKEGIPFPENCKSYQNKMDEFAMDVEIKKGNIPIERVQTPCIRCEFNKKDDMGKRYCSVWKWRIDNTRYYTAQDDGCSRGIVRDQYR